jgi:uncharacterized protein (TIGR02996 family)
VTTEDDFRRAIDAYPEDWQTVAVFSDWLRDRDDPRADGYAALVRRRCPLAQSFAKQSKEGRSGDWFAWMKVGLAVRVNRRGTAQPADREALRSDWYDVTRGRNELPDWNPSAWAYFRTRSDALDTAARGSATLPAKRRAELLAVPA